MEKKSKFTQTLQCLPCIISYLTQADRVRLSSVNSLVRTFLLQNNCWNDIQFTDFQENQSKWIQHCKWINKYLEIIKPTKFTLSIYNEHEPKEIVQTLMIKQINSVQSLQIYCQSQQVHLALSLCFPEITELILKSKCVSDQLMKFLGNNLKKLNSLTVIKNDMNFTAKSISTYIVQPMEKLQIKPYLLQFQQISLIAERSQDTLRQLQLDVEQCQNQLILKILYPLKKLQVLRLFHLENFSTDKELYPILKSQRLRQFCIGKAQSLPMSRIVQSLKSLNLVHLSVTFSELLYDEDIIYMSKGSPNLKHINVSWCTNLTNEGISALFENCKKLEEVYVTGLKTLEDKVFGEYGNFCDNFDEHHYNEIKYKIQKNTEKKQYYPIDEFFTKPVDTSTVNILKNIKVLDCISCNGISDKILKVIYVLRRKVKVINYYTNDLGLYAPYTQDDY